MLDVLVVRPPSKRRMLPSSTLSPIASVRLASLNIHRKNMLLVGRLEERMHLTSKCVDNPSKTFTC